MAEDNKDDKNFSSIDMLIKHYGVSDDDFHKRLIREHLELGKQLVLALSRIKNSSGQSDKTFMNVLMMSIASIVASDQSDVSTDRDDLRVRTHRMIDEMCVFLKHTSDSAIRSIPRFK